MWRYYAFRIEATLQEVADSIRGRSLIMRILIVANPVSGRGRSRKRSDALRALLTQRGHDSTIVASARTDARTWLSPHLKDVDVVAVVGGDGTVRSVAAAVAHAGIPLVHVPSGNENLFARALGMGSDIADTVRIIETGEHKLIDIGLVEEEAMLLMTSIGWDADIVANVATSRRDQVSNWDYVRAAMLRLQNWQPPLLTVTVDDELLVDRQRGWIVVSNASEYGGRVNPAPMACMDDRLLDVTFFRASSTLELMSWMLRCRFARQVSAPGFVHRRAASSVCISSAVPVRWQLDGDPPPSSSSSRTEHLSISLSDLRLPVLVPQGS